MTYLILVDIPLETQMCHGLQFELPEWPVVGNIHLENNKNDTGPIECGCCV